MSTRRLLTADLVRPFSCWSGSLLRPRLTSAAPSRHLTMPVAQWQDDRPPRVRRATFTLMPAAFTSAASVQVPGFEDMGLLTRDGRLVYGFCSSGQCFAFGFLQIPPHGGHPCRSASGSPCRAHRGLAPPSRPGRPPRRAGTAPLYGASRHAWRTQKKGSSRFSGNASPPSGEPQRHGPLQRSVNRGTKR